MLRVAGVLVGLMLAVVAAGSVEAAPTARASDPITIYNGPGYGYLPVGRLARDEAVTLAQCTPSGRWCYVVHDGPNGWVLASYLVGSAAKVQATPWRPLVNPGFGLFRQWHRRW